MATISAQNATITLNGVVLNDVIEYEVGVAVDFSRREQGAVRIQALSNSVFTSRRSMTQVRRLVISHGNSTTFDGWVLARSARVAAVRNDIVRYTFDFNIISLPALA